MKLEIEYSGIDVNISAEKEHDCGITEDYQYFLIDKGGLAEDRFFIRNVKTGERFNGSESINSGIGRVVRMINNHQIFDCE